MIARMWRGWTRATDVRAYMDGLQKRIDAQVTMPGKLGSLLLWRSQGDRCEVITISFWDSLDSVRTFAGEAFEQSVFYPLDEQYLVDRETTVAHYEVGGSEGIAIPGRGRPT